MRTEQKVLPGDMRRKKLMIETLVILVLAIVVYILSSHYDSLERLVAFSRQHESWEFDEFIAVGLFMAVALAFLSVKRWNDARNAKNSLLRRNEDLQKALSEIRQLRGIIPICSACKKIRDDEGFWHQVDSYVRDHSEAEFSHGICPDCMKKLYPGFGADAGGAEAKPD